MSQNQQCEGQSLVFTKDEFIRQYNILSASNNAIDKEAANQYILQFQNCNQIWSIAREIILDPPSIQLQVLGAQILCKKLKSHYSQLSIQQKLEVRKFLFEVLQQYCAVDNTVVSKLAKNQVVHSIAILGFAGIFQDWSTFLEDICDFMRLEGGDQYFICGIEILENVANQENMEKIVSDMKAFQRIRSVFQSQGSKVSGIFNTLLAHPNSNVGLKTLECIESWAGSQFKYQLFTDETLLNNLILLFRSTDQDVFEKVAKIMLESLKNSNNADILETANVTQSLNLISIEEVRSLKALIDVLVLRVNDFLTFDQLNPDSKFCKYYAEIATEIAQRFSIIILENSEHSKKLLKLMVICTQHSNLNISYTTFDFWVQFYHTLKTYVTNILDPQSDWLIEPYLEVFTTVLGKSKLKKIKITPQVSGTIDNDAGMKKMRKNYQLLKRYTLFQDGDDFNGFGGDLSSSQSRVDEFGNNESGDDEISSNLPHSFDLDQIDQTFEKIRVKDYRIYARDLFNTVYNVLSQFRGQQGVNTLLQILYTLINKEQFLALNSFQDSNQATQQYYISVEVCLFAVQTMAENMFPGTDTDQNNFSYFLEFIVNNNEFPTHQSTVYMAMQLFYNAQSELSKNAHLFDATIKFILRYILDENLDLMSSQTFTGIIKGVGQNDQIDTFRYVTQFFIQNVDRIFKQEVMDELIQGVFGFALNLKTEEHKLEATQNLLSLVQQMLDNTKTTLDTITTAKEKQTLLLRTVGILQSLLSGFSAETISLGVKSSIGTFIQQNFNFLTLAFDKLTLKSNAQPIISQFINIFRFIIKIFSDESSNLIFYESNISFLNTSIMISQRSPILFCEAMKIFRMIIELTKNTEYHSAFQVWLEQNFNQYNEFYLKFMTQTDSNAMSSNYATIKIQHEVNRADKNKDPDLITNFYDIQLQVLTNFSQFYLNHNQFHSVVEFSLDVVKNICQYEMTRSIIKFYYEFIKECCSPLTSEYVLKILDTTIDILPHVNSNLMHNISILFIQFAQINRNQVEQLHQYMLQCFITKEDKYAQLTNNQKKILVDCIIKFSLENNSLNSLKSLLGDLYSVCKGLYSAQEMFMNYELKLKGLNSSSTVTSNQSRQLTQSTVNGVANHINSPSFNHIQQNFLNQLSATLLARNQSAKNAINLEDNFN